MYVENMALVAHLVARHRCENAHYGIAVGSQAQCVVALRHIGVGEHVLLQHLFLIGYGDENVAVGFVDGCRLVGLPQRFVF